MHEMIFAPSHLVVCGSEKFRPVGWTHPRGLVEELTGHILQSWASEDLSTSRYW